MSPTIGLSSPLMVEEEAKIIHEKQGIVSILGSGGEKTKSATLRRTLSADMSSKKWFTQHGYSPSPMKKIASSNELSIAIFDSSSSSEEEEEEEYEGRNKPKQIDWWSSILSQKKEKESSDIPPPYVHPLVKRSSSSLSMKSLEICTESLGSETGSDVFSSCAPSDTGAQDKEVQLPPPQEKEYSQSFDREEFRVVKYNYSTSEKLQAKSFPPPLPSLARRDGPSLQVQPRRENGRLVLEAVSVPSKNRFRAQRQDGRLLLTLANNSPQEESNREAEIEPEEDTVHENGEEVFDNFEKEKDDGAKEGEKTKIEEEEEEEEVVKKVEKGNGVEDFGIVMEEAPKLSSGVINVHRSAVMIKKLMEMDNRKPNWTKKFNEGVNLEEESPAPLAQSLPPPPWMGRLIPSPTPATAAAASFNAYEYFWRAKTTVATAINNNCSKADYLLVPLLRGCKEARRSLLMREPYCIASS